MPTTHYNRNIGELRNVASMFWPAELSAKEAEISVIPKLLETQEDFISILSVKVEDLEHMYRVLEASTMPANLFLKHLVVLSDFGGEMLQRINTQFPALFPLGRMTYIVNGRQITHTFNSLPMKGSLSNAKLSISGRKLLENKPISPLYKDAITTLMYGSVCTDENTANILRKCEVGNYLGDPEKLEKFIKERYIWVSRITGGAKANSLGQIAQDYVKDYITENLRVRGARIKRGGTLPGVTHRDPTTGKLTSFDIVVSANDKHAAIEVSFQVTTNSTIERKAGQARARYEQTRQNGHKIAYVIDGAGNFQRENAISTLCNYSHCTVAFSQPELDILCRFLRRYLTTH